ncbi:MAG: penicillin-binding protein 2 [Planctomycetota bacterium]
MTGRGPEAIDGRQRWVLAGLRFGAIALGVVVLGRVAQLQWAPAPELSSRLGQQWSERSLTPSRAPVLDRRGRVLASSHTGYRVFVDPERLTRLDEVIPHLAEAVGVGEDAIGERVVEAMARADARREAIKAWKNQGSDPDANPGLRFRFASITGLLEPERVDAVRQVCSAHSGVHLEPVAVRAIEERDGLAPLVGKVGRLKVGQPIEGLAGAERTQNAALSGEPGGVRFVRDHRGRALWMSPGAWTSPRDGEPIRLTIDQELQRLAMQELRRGVEEADAAGGRVVMIDPTRGDVLAIVDVLRSVPGVVEFPWEPIDPTLVPEGWTPREIVEDGSVRYRTQLADPLRAREPALARNRCVVDVYEPGSTIKPLIWSALTDAGVAEPDESFDTEGGRWRTTYGRPIEDVTRRDTMSWTEVLRHSSNIGMAKATERISHEALHDLVRAFGLGRRTGVPLPGEARGLVTPKGRWTKFSQTSVSFGYEIAVTPVQMARAYAALARSGPDAGTLPSLRLVAREGAEPTGVVERVVSPEAAMRTREVLVAVAERAEEKMARRDPPERGLDGADAWRFGWFGKSGTAEIPIPTPPKGWRRPRQAPKAYFDRQYASSFIGAGPIESPQLLVVVVIDDPGPELVNARRYYGSDVAAPVARRLLERSLSYLGIEPDQTPTVLVDERKLPDPQG